jgi:hypothetical protein
VITDRSTVALVLMPTHHLQIGRFSNLPSGDQDSGFGGGYWVRTKRSHMRSVIRPRIPITTLADGVTL